MTKIVATSDFHGNLPTIPECDLLIIAGDICPSKAPLEQAAWLDTTFRSWLDSTLAKEVVAIAGNHDQIFEKAPELIPNGLRWHYLQDSSITLFDLLIYGTPWQLPFWGAFNLADDKLTEVYKKIPEKTDIIVSHGPPYGLHDQIITKKPDGKTSIFHTGSVSLQERIFDIKPKLCLFGHIHTAFGSVSENGTTFANVSLVNDDLKVTNSPVIFELNTHDKQRNGNLS
jgi:Icc-related predicted phosphoesterase